MFKKHLKSILLTILVCLFVGVFSVSATWPNAPEGSIIGGWLGSIFDLDATGSGELVVNGNVVANTPTKGTHLATKDYVDAAEGGGGGSITTGLFADDAGTTRFFYSCGETNCCGYKSVNLNGNISSVFINAGSACDTGKKCQIDFGDNPKDAECMYQCSTGGFASDGTCDGDGDGLIDISAGGLDPYDNNADYGTNLYGSIHERIECVADGGEVFDANGVPICKFPRSSCSGDWTPYGSWRKYADKTCDGRITVSGNLRSNWTTGATCSANGTSFNNANTPPNSCQYWQGIDINITLDDFVGFGGDYYCNGAYIVQTVLNNDEYIDIYNRSECNYSFYDLYVLPHYIYKIVGNATYLQNTTCYANQISEIGCY